MNTKEAIDFLIKKMHILLSYEHKEKDDGDMVRYGDMVKIKEYIDEWNEVISLLQQGEAYRQMWGELKGNRPRPIGTYWEKYINRLEQKYFPKSIKKEEVIK